MGAVRTVQGIVLRYANYREADRMMTLFTREYGRMDVVARGCRRINSRLLSCTQTFCYGEYVLAERNGKFSVQQCELQDAFFDIRLDLDKLGVGTAMVLLAEEGALPDAPDENLFMLLLHSLTHVCYGENKPIDLLLYFLMHYLSLLGYQVALESCAHCGRSLALSTCFDINAGALCDACATSGCVHIPALAHKAMRRMLLLPSSQMGKVALPEAVREALLRALVPFAQIKLERRFKPLDFLLQLKKPG